MRFCRRERCNRLNQLEILPWRFFHISGANRLAPETPLISSLDENGASFLDQFVLRAVLWQRRGRDLLGSALARVF